MHFQRTHLRDTPQLSAQKDIQYLHYNKLWPRIQGQKHLFNTASFLTKDLISGFRDEVGFGFIFPYLQHYLLFH